MKLLLSTWECLPIPYRVDYYKHLTGFTLLGRTLLTLPTMPPPQFSLISLFSLSPVYTPTKALVDFSFLLVLELAILSWNVLRISHPPPLPHVRTAISHCSAPGWERDPHAHEPLHFCPCTVNCSVPVCLFVFPQNRC